MTRCPHCNRQVNSSFNTFTCPYCNRKSTYVQDLDTRDDDDGLDVALNIIGSTLVSDSFNSVSSSFNSDSGVDGGFSGGFGSDFSGGFGGDFGGGGSDSSW